MAMAKARALVAAASVLALCTTAFVAVVDAQALPGPFSIDASSVSLSGLSAGGYAAQQFHVAFSASIKGAAILAGGPYYCANNDLNTALIQCMPTDFFINVPRLVSLASTCGDSGRCDDVSHLRESKVWLYSGTLDSTVVPGVMRKLEQFYQDLGVVDMELKFDLPAAHSWPTLSYGSPCVVATSPYISSCGYSAAQELMTSIYGPLNAFKSTPETHERLVRQVVHFSQGDYHNGTSTAAGLHPSGYVFIPSGCQPRNSQHKETRRRQHQCRIHVAWHGCQMTQDFIQLQFVEHSELIEIGEANDIIVLFPQAINSTFPLNPNGCFDWWGYTGSDYAEKSGVQNRFVQTVVNTLAGEIIIS